MPILKSVTLNNKEATFHEVTSVNIFKFANGLGWAGKFRSYAMEFDKLVLVHVGEVSDLPYDSAGIDPIGDFEQAAVSLPTSLLYGGTLVSGVDDTTLLPMAKVLAWDKVVAARDAFINSGVDAGFGRFDSDLNTLVNAMGSITTMAEGATKNWIRADHTVVALTKIQVWDLGLALEAIRIDAYAQGAALYAQIQAATTVAAVKAITWSNPVSGGLW